MRVYYDFHIHTGLSPCGDKDMTPNNIVNMAMINELNAIAVTDHNTVKNARSVIEAARAIDESFLVIPGMELETAEEIHCVCLFPSFEAAMEFDRFVEGYLSPLKNRPKIFGNQHLFDSTDNIIGELDAMLIGATSLDIETAAKTVRDMGGAFYPAHIDRSSNSILANLGFISEEMSMPVVEVSKAHDGLEFLTANKRILRGVKRFVQSSDAHYLEDIAEAKQYIDISGEIPIMEIMRFLRGEDII